MKNAIYLLLLIVFIIGACVPLSQYKQLEEDKLSRDAGYEHLRNENHSLDVTNTEIKSRIQVLERHISRLNDENLQIKRDYNRIEDKYNKTNELYQNLLKMQTELASGTDRESSRILKELQALQQSLMEKEDRLIRMESSLDQKRRNLEQLQEEFTTQNSRLMELESVLSHKDSIMNGLRAKVAQALYAFDSDELSVELRNGKVYVSLEEKLLFGSGSYKVAVKGQDALRKLAVVLKQNPDIQILIEGHTDNVPIISKSDLMIDNWDLSVKRATSIVRILLDNSGIDPKRLTAAGRGEFLPIADNKISEGKQKNRRTEIILTPRLDELFNLIGN